MKLPGRIALFALVFVAVSSASATSAIIRVKWDSPNNGPGNDWAHAFRTVGSAINASTSGDEVWVAGSSAHPYYETVTLKNGVAVYGGFGGSEASLQERSTIANTTVLDGRGASLFRAVLALEGIGPGTRLDGFTIRNSDEGIRCYASSPTITGNRLVGNRQGIYCYAGAPTILSNIITANEDGGVVCREASTPAIVNNTITAGSSGVYWDSSSSPIIINNIIAFNMRGLWNNSPSNIDKNCLYNPGGVDSVKPIVGGSNLISDPLLVGHTYGDMHLTPESPCINAGKDDAETASGPDVDGQPRSQGAHVDIGADEFDGAPMPPFAPRVYRVAPSGQDANDGSSWISAKKTIASAANAAAITGGEVWVSAGTYPGQVVLKPFIHLYGGFSGSERERVQRKPHTYTSVMYGDGAVPLACSRGGRHVCSTDGFTISSSGTAAYGVFCNTASPIITNNIIEGFNSGVYGYLTAARVSGNVIRGNRDHGIYLDFYCYATVTGNTIYNNVSYGISCSGAGLSNIHNNIVAYNGYGVGKSSNAGASLDCNCVFNPDGMDYSGIAAGPGDIRSNPLFVDQLAGDYHLQPTSPCINAGLNTAVGIPMLDFDGQGRVFGGRVDIGVDEWWSANLSIPDVKGAPDGAIVSGDGAVVTAAWPDAFYIEADSRASGIRVERLGHGLSAGLRASISGTAATNADGERCILANSVTPSGQAAIEPLIVRNRYLGGESLTFPWTATPGQSGILGSIGLNNIGLLVTTSGVVKAPRTPSGWFYIDDGSGASDGSGTPGIYVEATGLALPQEGQIAVVTGISSCEWYRGNLVNVLRPRGQFDINPLPFLGDPPPPPPFGMLANPRER